MLGRDDGAHVYRLVEGRAHPERFHAALELGDEWRGDALLHDQARAGAAHLALIEPDGIDDAFDGAIEIGIVEDDEGRLAAELEGERLAGTRRLVADEAAHFGRTGEGDLVDTFVRHQGGSGFAGTGDDIDDARRQAHLAAEFGEEKRCERRIFGGLQDHRIAERDSRRDLPGQHEEREIPRHDLADDADGIEPGEFRLLESRPAGMVIEMAGGEGNIDVAGLADRLAVVEGFDHGEEPGMALHHPRQRIEMAGAPCAAKCLPGAERLARRLDRTVDIGGTARATRARILPVAGSTVSKLAPESAGCHSPPMKSEKPASWRLSQARASLSASGAGP